MSAPRVTTDELVVSIPIDVKLWNQSSDRFWIPHLNLCGIQYIDRSLIPPSLLQKFEGGEFAWTSLLDEIDARLKCSNAARVIFWILRGAAYACVSLSLLILASLYVTIPGQTLMKSLIRLYFFGLVLFVAFIIMSVWMQHKTEKMRAKIQKGKQTKIT